jgi:hypothetical protein
MNGIDAVPASWATSAKDEGYAEIPLRVLLSGLDPRGPAAAARRAAVPTS